MAIRLLRQRGAVLERGPPGHDGLRTDAYWQWPIRMARIIQNAAGLARAGECAADSVWM